MKYLWTSITCFIIAAYAFSLIGCGPTKNALIAEQAYYRAMKEIALAQKPMVDIEIADPTKPVNVKRIVVHAPSSEQLKQYVQKDYYASVVNAFLQSLGILAPWAGAAVIVGQVAGHVAGPVTNVNASGGSQAMTGGTMSNATSVPTVVTQPVPVIVQPSYPPLP